MTTKERIALAETELRRQENLLASLYEKECEETRFLSLEDRDLLLDEQREMVECSVATNDAVDALMDTQCHNRGYSDRTDEELLVDWFGPFDENQYNIVLDNKLWKNRLSNNLAAVQLLGKWASGKSEL